VIKTREEKQWGFGNFVREKGKLILEKGDLKGR
jgi:hypothetical protein